MAAGEFGEPQQLIDMSHPLESPIQNESGFFV